MGMNDFKISKSLDLVAERINLKKHFTFGHTKISAPTKDGWILLTDEEGRSKDYSHLKGTPIFFGAWWMDEDGHATWEEKELKLYRGKNIRIPVKKGRTIIKEGMTIVVAESLRKGTP